MTTTTKNKNKTTSTKNAKQKRTKKNDDKIEMIIVNNVEMTIDNYRDELLKQLRLNRDNTKLCKRIRHLLRKKCKHYGALRNRTYVDQTTMQKIHVDKTT